MLRYGRAAMLLGRKQTEQEQSDNQTQPKREYKDSWSQYSPNCQQKDWIMSAKVSVQFSSGCRERLLALVNILALPPDCCPQISSMQYSPLHVHDYLYNTHPLQSRPLPLPSHLRSPSEYVHSSASCCFNHHHLLP